LNNFCERHIRAVPRNKIVAFAADSKKNLQNRNNGDK
jgi:hypothetical protein